VFLHGYRRGNSTVGVLKNVPGDEFRFPSANVLFKNFTISNRAKVILDFL
jgi:hypothetical protein